MVFHVITIFPEAVEAYLGFGILSKAVGSGAIEAKVYDLRDYTANKYRKVDKPVFGHGKGMLFEPEPVAKAIREIKSLKPSAKVVYLTPQGAKFDNRMAKELAGYDDIVLVASRYEGVDARAVELFADYEISVGDYVLTGGELPALTVMDAAARFVEGTVKTESVEADSFEDGLVEYEHWTEPLEFEGLAVPEVLRSGDHKAIREFRFERSLRKTYFNRPDLLRDYPIPAALSESGNELKVLKKRNGELEKYKHLIQRISKEWRDGRRNRKERN